ncbi:hypothetical protein R1flu_014901 [Riccia fluitans]|uniref:Uncharacterized protein n=1 Tax=Riccia fluitans TaxID=41844 RepID=A0ABD1YHS2_9MARC
MATLEAFIRVLGFHIILITQQKFIQGYVDQNTIYDPCKSQPTLIQDAITIGVAFIGDITTWYNNSDVRSNVLSPCEAPLADKLTNVGFISIFRPQIDQLTLLNVDNGSLISLSNTFAQTVSLLLYAQGMNKTILAGPRSFMNSYGMVPSFTTIIDFQNGFLKNFTWKDDECLDCAQSSMCLDNNCVDPQDRCTADSTNSSSCHFSINLAFSGTDRKKKPLQSWYQISRPGRFSLTNIYQKVKNDIITSIITIGNAIDSPPPLG